MLSGSSDEGLDEGLERMEKGVWSGDLCVEGEGAEG